MWKDVKAILLPTNNETRIWQHYKTKHLQLSQENTKYHLTDNLFGNHIYIISLNEEIKLGDWCYHPEVSQQYTIIKNGIQSKEYHPAQRVFQYKTTTNDWYKKCRKIIAATDNSLSDISEGQTFTKLIPEIPQQFIEEYISEYNKGNVLEDVEVGYEAMNTTIIDRDYKDFELKISKDNFISLRRKETKLYTREEVVIKCLKMQHDYTKFVKESYYTPNMREIAEWTDNWIQQNL